MPIYKREPPKDVGKELRDEQERVQKKTFTNWINTYLRQLTPPLKITDLYHDIKDGIVLLTLLEILSGETLPKEGKKGLQRVHFLTNVRTALKFLEERSIKTVNINATDIVDGKPAIVLGLIWTIILYFQIEEQEDQIMKALGIHPENGESVKGSGKKALLAWVDQAVSSHYGVQVKDFGASWRDGKAFSALVHNIDPSLLDMEQLAHRTNRENLENAFNTAEKCLGVPKLLDPEDVDVEKPDEKCIMTYVTQFLKSYPEGGKPSGEEEDTVAQSHGKKIQKGRKRQSSDEAELTEEEPSNQDQQQHHLLGDLQNIIEKLENSLPQSEVSVTDPVGQFQKLQKLVGELQQGDQLLKELRAKLASGDLNEMDCENMNEAQSKWNAIQQRIQEWKWKIDQALPGQLGGVGKWLAAAERVLYTPLPESDNVNDLVVPIGKRLNEHKMIFKDMDRILELFQDCKGQQNDIPLAQMQDMELRMNRIGKVEPGFYRKLDYLDGRYKAQSKLEDCQEKVRKWADVPYGDAQEVNKLLQDFQVATQRVKISDVLDKLTDQFIRKGDLYKKRELANDPDASDALVDLTKNHLNQVQKLKENIPKAEASLKEMVNIWTTWNGDAAIVNKHIEDVESLLNSENPDLTHLQVCTPEVEKILSQMSSVLEQIRGKCRPDVARGANDQLQDLHKRLNTFEAVVEVQLQQQKAKTQEKIRQQQEAEERAKQEEEARLQEAKRQAEMARQEEERQRKEKEREERRRKEQEEEERLRKEEEEKREKRRQEELQLQKMLQEAEERARQQEEARLKKEVEQNLAILTDGSQSITDWLEDADMVLEKSSPGDLKLVKKLLDEMQQLDAERDKVAAQMKQVKVAATKLEEIERSGKLPKLPSAKSVDSVQVDKMESHLGSVNESLPQRVQELSCLLPTLESLSRDFHDIMDWLDDAENLEKDLRTEKDPEKAKILRAQHEELLAEAPSHLERLKHMKAQMESLKSKNCPNLNLDSLTMQVNDVGECLKNLVESSDEDTELMKIYATKAQKTRHGVNRLKKLLDDVSEIERDNSRSPDEKASELKKVENEMKEVEESLQEATRALKQATGKSGEGEKQALHDELEEVKKEMDSCLENVDAARNRLNTQKQKLNELHKAGDLLKSRVDELNDAYDKLESAEYDPDGLEKQSKAVKVLLKEGRDLGDNIKDHKNKCKAANAVVPLKQVKSLKADWSKLMADLSKLAELRNNQENAQKAVNEKLDIFESQLHEGKEKRAKLQKLSNSPEHLTQKEEILDALVINKEKAVMALNALKNQVDGLAQTLPSSSKSKLMEMPKQKTEEFNKLYGDLEDEIEQFKKLQQQKKKLDQELQAIKASLKEAELKWSTAESNLKSAPPSLAANTKALEAVEAILSELNPLSATLEKFEASTKGQDLDESHGQEVLKAKSSYEKLLQKAKQAHETVLQANNQLQALERTQTKIERWLHEAEERLESCSSPGSDVECIRGRLQMLTDEVALHQDDLDEMKRLQEGNHSANVPNLESRYNALSKKIHSSSNQLNDLHEKKQTYQHQLRSTNSWIENTAQKLLKCSNSSEANSTKLAAHLTSAKSIADSIKEGQLHVNATRSAAEQLIHASESHGFPVDTPEIRTQLADLDKDWNSLTDQVNVVCGCLEQAQKRWQDHEDNQEKLKQWLAEAEKSFEKAVEAQNNNGDSFRASCERFKMLKRDVDQRVPDFQNLQKTSSELLSPSEGNAMLKENTQLHQRFRALVENLKTHIHGLEQVEHVQHDYETALQECEKWILQMSFHLLQESNQRATDPRPPHPQTHGDGSCNGQPSSSKASNLVDTVKQLHQQATNHGKMSKEIASKAYEVEHVKTLGNRVLQIGQATSNPELSSSIKAELKALQERYDDICDSDQQVQSHLAQELLHVMESFLDGDLKAWWNALDMNESDGESLERRKQDVKHILQQTETLWNEVKPHAMQYSLNTPASKVTSSHLHTTAANLMEVAPKEIEKLKMHISIIDKVSGDLKEFETSLNEFSRWLEGVQTEWQDCLSNPNKEGNNFKKEALRREVNTKRRNLDTLDRLHKTLADSGLIPINEDDQLQQLKEKMERLQGAMDSDAKQVAERLNQEKLLQQKKAEQEANKRIQERQTQQPLTETKRNGTQTMPLYVPKVNAFTKQTQTVVEDSSRPMESTRPFEANKVLNSSDEFGLRNSGGNHGISKNFWPYYSPAIDVEDHQSAPPGQQISLQSTDLREHSIAPAPSPSFSAAQSASPAFYKAFTEPAASSIRPRGSSPSPATSSTPHRVRSASLSRANATSHSKSKLPTSSILLPPPRKNLFPNPPLPAPAYSIPLTTRPSRAMATTARTPVTGPLRAHRVESSPVGSSKPRTNETHPQDTKSLVNGSPNSSQSPMPIRFTKERKDKPEVESTRRNLLRSPSSSDLQEIEYHGPTGRRASFSRQVDGLYDLLLDDQGNQKHRHRYAMPLNPLASSSQTSIRRNFLEGDQLYLYLNKASASARELRKMSEKLMQITT